MLGRLGVASRALAAGAALLAKGTLGVLAALHAGRDHRAARRPAPACERLRVPDLLVQIMGFMVRYLDVVTAELRPDDDARCARAASTRAPRGTGRSSRRSLGALFIRSYERGERVHLAMLARGYDGTMPASTRRAPGTPMSTPVLDVHGLAYAYPDGHQALFGVDLHVHRGERVALLGPNGAGKTTLVLHLNGILAAGAGTVAVSGLPVRQGEPPEIRRRVGVVFQDPDDQLFMPTVREDVAFGPGQPRPARRRARRAASRDALERVGMADFADRPPHHLSFGQRRRVAVATVLAMEPEILVLDEPSSNLDPASRRELADILRSLDVTVLMVTHDLPYALELCPRSVVLHDGAVVADGATYDLLTDDELMRRHRLELPFGFDPATHPRHW